MGYTYASIDVVNAGRRFTLYTMIVNQFTEKAMAVEKLIREAKRATIAQFTLIRGNL